MPINNLFLPLLAGYIVVLCENSSCCTLMKHALISMYSMLLKVYWKLHNGPVTLSTSNKYRGLDASTFTLHRGSDVPWTSRSSRAWRGSTQHLLPVVKMTQHRGYFCQESERWRLVAGDCWWFSLPGCVGPRIQSIWEILVGRWDDEKEM